MMRPRSSMASPRAPGVANTPMGTVEEGPWLAVADDTQPGGAGIVHSSHSSSSATPICDSIRRLTSSIPTEGTWRPPSPVTLAAMRCRILATVPAVGRCDGSACQPRRSREMTSAGTPDGIEGRKPSAATAVDSSCRPYPISRMVCASGLSRVQSLYGDTRASSSFIVTHSAYTSDAGDAGRVFSSISGAIYSSVPSIFVFWNPPLGEPVTVDPENSSSMAS
mmetsp:Transcript_895/g.2595  ORF Transcript_895/g.2595 Transcript_895/m.2595 type:complete len:222 (-) Transcript_895:849-1514(-)